MCVVVGYQLLGFEEIGVEIESPFGTDDVRCRPQFLKQKSRARVLQLPR